MKEHVNDHSIKQLQNQSSRDCDSTDLNKQQGTIGVPFHLSVSQNYRQQTGFTNSIPSESISYDPITSLAKFDQVVRYDVGWLGIQPQLSRQAQFPAFRCPHFRCR